jgi:hypothetical protein
LHELRNHRVYRLDRGTYRLGGGGGRLSDRRGEKSEREKEIVKWENRNRKLLLDRYFFSI